MGGHMQQSNGASLWDPPGGGLIHNVGSTSDVGDVVMARWLHSAGLQHLSLLASTDGFYSPELRGEFEAGLLDLHVMDDIELLSEHVLSNSFEPSPFMFTLVKGISDNFVMVTSRKQKEQVVERLSSNDKDNNNNLAKIKVVRTKATCFAYGQTGSGKRFTMQPLPIRDAEDIMRLLYHPTYRNQIFKLWLSFFEIYGGKLYDLLSDRRKLCMRKDGRQQVFIVGLQKFEAADVQIIKEYNEKGNAARSTGSTGANEESSRSHVILQLVIEKHSVVKESKRHKDENEYKAGKIVGKISFIDLAGSERGADTTDNDRQTQIEGAEINKPILALKEFIRALKMRMGISRLSVLRKLVDDAPKFLNDKVTKAVVTVPAYFNDSQITAIKDVGRIAGLEVLCLINVPTAASLVIA
ncbi:hypothetical protein GIB67_014985 [Kingdonia uniflora]|uniref:Kinesin-like protein n=1 Tax=Kingdonia uniflora TaxID=39325 RepID=A0A7J7MTE6_9MAGN|nr:hypothetical protein GIB67_014985 [Kingdonia uniflora]